MVSPITSYDLEKATGRVDCGKKGTCFLISPELVLTAAHVVKTSKKANTPIVVQFLNISETLVERTASLLEYDFEQLDVAILKLDSPVELERYVPLVSCDIANGENYFMYGYPNAAYTAGKKIEDTVSRTNLFNTKWDIDLNLQSPFNTKGLSGAALVIDGFAVGLVLTQLDNSLHAISTKKFKDLIEKNQIPFLENRLEDDIPDSLKQEAGEMLDSSNTPVVEKLNKCLLEIKGGYALLTGSPGSGKTTLVANYSPDIKELEVAGRYFVKVPNDSQTLAIRASKERLLSWLEAVCYRILFNQPPEKKQIKFNEKIKEVTQLLSRLGESYKKKNKLGVLLIDGLDDANKTIEDNLSDFLSILPAKLPDNLCILFSCTSKAILPSVFQSQILKEREINITPLEKENVERFISQAIEKTDLNLTINQIAKLRDKSEGHPLYLRYLVNYVINHNQQIQVEIEGFDKWMNSIPVIEGDIEVYYKSIWHTIKDKPEESRIVGTISRLRQRAPIEAIAKMLPEESREIWDSTYLKVNHLLSEDETETDKWISIYHTSFGEFINGVTESSNIIIHNRIAQYCLEDQNTFYGLSNVIYHLYNGNDSDKTNAIGHCNQEWVNGCAIKSISPDSILTDIREILRLCFKFKKSVDVIRVLLLLQRMRFRYDEIFRENAFELTSLLLAMGKPDEAVRYVIRNGILQISESDTVFLLQKFYEADGKSEAEELLEVLDLTYKQKLSEDFEKGYLDFSNLMMKFNAVAISSSSNLRIANSKFLYFNNRMKDIEDRCEDDSNDKKEILRLRTIASAFYFSYAHWSFNSYVPIRKMLEVNIPADKKTTLIWAMRIPLYKQFQRNSLVVSNDNPFPEIIDDLEFLITDYGVDDEDVMDVVEALIPYSKNSKLVENLINKWIEPPIDEFSIREENGVNADLQSVIKQINYYTLLGYLGNEEKKPRVPDRVNWNNWEGHLVSIIEKIGYFQGYGFRLKADSKIEDLGKLLEELKSFLSSLEFTLLNRIDWREKRAYALPEEIYPIIYSHITEFILEFYPEFIPDFVETIIKNSEEQLGLYTEGYRNSLFKIADELILIPGFRKPTFKLLDQLEKHIYQGVQNRWERAPELMKLAELYARIEADEKAEEVFKMMLNSSMGISWYKEAQLDLITSAIENLHGKDSDFTNLETFAGHLDFASGEMTFQRYVRMEKERFVHSLCKIGCLDKAILYFKQVTLSTPKGVKERAESSVIDTPFIGEGYELGAREIEEENAILNLFKAFRGEVNIYFKWVLGELFVSDDIHYSQDFAKLFGEVISTLENSDTTQIDFLINRLVEVIKTKIDKPFQQNFINNLFHNLPQERSKKLHDLLMEKGILNKEEGSKIEDSGETSVIEPTTVETSQERESILDGYVQKAKSELEFGNKGKAKDLLVEGWEKETEKKYSIFDTNSKDSFDVLLEASDSDSDILDTCEDIILNDPYKEEWVLASRLIGLLGGKIDKVKKKALLETVLNHLDLMLRTTEQKKEIFERYEWLKDATSEKCTNVQLAEFIIWLLNYPNFNSNETIIELILWLCSVEPEIIIPLLVEEAFLKDSIISSELSMYILFKVASNGGIKILWENLKNKEIDILGEDHFMKKYALLKTIEVISSEIKEAKILFQGLEATFSPTPSVGADVEPEWDWLKPIEEPFALLQEDGFINGKLCRELEDNVGTACMQFGIEKKELGRINQYYKRSFYNQKNFVSPIEYIPRYALNKAICSTVSLSRAKEAANNLGLVYDFFN